MKLEEVAKETKIPFGKSDAIKGNNPYEKRCVKGQKFRLCTNTDKL